MLGDIKVAFNPVKRYKCFSQAKRQRYAEEFDNFFERSARKSLTTLNNHLLLSSGDIIDADNLDVKNVKSIIRRKRAITSCKELGN